MKTDPTSPIKSQLCDIRRAGSQLQNIMDGRNAAARSSIITGRLRRIVGNESSVRLSLSLSDFSFRENIVNEKKDFFCGKESMRVPLRVIEIFLSNFFFPPYIIILPLFSSMLASILLDCDLSNEEVILRR